MKFGMNTLLWSVELNDKVMPIVEKLKHMGFDGIEVPIFDYDVKKYEKFGKRLDDLGLGRTAVTCRYAEDNPVSTDAKIRALGVTNTCRTIDCCQALGVTVLAGPYHSTLGAVHQQSAHGRRMEMERRRHAQSGRACRQGQDHAGRRVFESF